MVIALPPETEGPNFTRVVKRLQNNNGMPIEKSNNNPIKDTRIYKVKYCDGHRAVLSENVIAQNMITQVDDEGNGSVLFSEIIDYRTNGKELRQQDAFISSRSGGKRRRQTIKGYD